MGVWKKFFVDGFDNYVSYGVRNLLKLLECFLVIVLFYFFIKIVVLIVVNEVKKLIFWYSFLVME